MTMHFLSSIAGFRAHPAASNLRATPAAKVLAFIVILAAVWLRFSWWVPTAFYGDDLNYFMEFTKGTCATQAGDILTAICQERFRPVASAFVIAEMALFGTNIHFYIVINALVLALTSFFFFLTCLRLSKGRIVVSLLITLAVATSRFAAYHFTQVLGPVESLTLLFCVSSVYCYIKVDDSASRHYWWALLAVGAATMAAFTHERTLVLAAWLVPAFLLSSTLRSGSRPKLVGLVLACCAIPILYVSYKTFVLSTAFMVGTGGTRISIDSATIMLHGKQALLSLFGFNSGPEYLVGMPVTSHWTAAFALASMFALSWCLMLSVGVSSSLRTANGFARSVEAFRLPLLIVALVVATLGPTLLTIRLEQRWLLIPFTLLMLIPAWAVGAADVRLRVFTSMLAIILPVSSIALDTLISQHFSKLFFVNSMRYAAAMKQDLAKFAVSESGTVALLAGSEHCQWTLGGGAFFTVYTGRSKSLRCFSSLEEETKAALPPATRVYGVDAEAGIVDLTAEGNALRLAKMNTIQDFIEDFQRGKISNETPVSSPTGRGAFVMPWNSSTGIRSTITIISGYEYAFNDIEIPTAGLPQLVFGMSMTYSSATSARATIRVSGSDTSHPPVVLQRDLKAPGADGTLAFVSESLALQQFAGQHVTVSFGVDSPHGSPNGHWIAFSSPRIVLKE